MSENNKNNIAFLFGAGISQDSLISTGELTTKIIEANNIARVGGGYIEHDNPRVFDGVDIWNYLPRIKKLFEIVQDTFKDHYLYNNLGMNYEDLYYLINALYEDENGEYSNPIVSKYCDTLIEEYTALFKSEYTELSDLRLIDLTKEALNYIHDFIVISLDRHNAPVDHLSFLSEIDNDQSFSKVYIFTLNHDLLIEKYCHNKIELSDGFIPDGSGNKIWTPKSFVHKFSLLKLHGSINWYRMTGPDLYDDKTVIYGLPQRGHERPLIIIGRFNKLQAYSRSINFELQCLFADQLNQSDTLIISGYSFGDQGINSRIINWALGSRARNIVLIHKNPDDLIRNARPAIRSVFSFLEKNNKIAYIKDFITKNTKWSEIKSFIIQ